MKLRQELFWDANSDRIDLDKNASYIIERVLDFGNDEEVKWLIKRYPKSLIKNTVASSRSIRPKTKKLWTLITDKN